ncbi:hypothetical protein L6452_09546 [Arctium lappa]|uniref:Uncharacterized protein n=1 Tax=Arctium lappa TaxID=4217 RepID=A0ACB9DLI4_ARCLA|nr:hypothetical protein L6452_09546 [Arctium lappa]
MISSLSLSTGELSLSSLSLSIGDPSPPAIQLLVALPLHRPAHVLLHRRFSQRCLVYHSDQSVGLGLSLVFGCLLLALVAELNYLLWWKKLQSSRCQSTGGWLASS